MTTRARFQLALLVLTFEALSPPKLAPAQQPPSLVAGFYRGLAFIDRNNGGFFNRMGYQVAGYIGRPLAVGEVGVVEVAVTTVGTGHVAYPPCPSPGCAIRVANAGLSFAPGLQWYAATHTRRATFTLAPGAVWFVSHTSGTDTVIPKVGFRFDLGWLLKNGPRIGLSSGIEWWGSNGDEPQWVIPLGFTLGVS